MYFFKHNSERSHMYPPKAHHFPKGKVSRIFFMHFLLPSQVLIEDTPAVFRLTQGSGPIHLSGTHQVETTIIEDDMDDSLAEEEGEEEDEVEEEVEELPVSSSWTY